MYWTIDSKYRKTKRMDRFLRDQLNLVTKDSQIYKLAMSLRKDNSYLTVYNIEKYVIRNFDYKTDYTNYGASEYWADVDQILGKKADDCDGLNSLIFILCRLAGIPESNIYCVLGDTSVDEDSVLDHFWCIFFDSRRSRFVKLDATLYPKVEFISSKKKFKLGGVYKTADYLFNDGGIWKFK